MSYTYIRDGLEMAERDAAPPPPDEVRAERDRLLELLNWAWFAIKFPDSFKYQTYVDVVAKLSEIEKLTEPVREKERLEREKK